MYACSENVNGNQVGSKCHIFCVLYCEEDYFLPLLLALMLSCCGCCFCLFCFVLLNTAIDIEWHPIFILLDNFTKWQLKLFNHTCKSAARRVFIHIHKSILPQVRELRERLVRALVSSTAYVCLCMCECVQMMIIFHTVKLAMFCSASACGLAIKISSQCVSLFSFSVEIRLDAQSDENVGGKFYVRSLFLYRSFSFS